MLNAGIEPAPPACKSDALPTELTRQTQESPTNHHTSDQPISYVFLILISTVCAIWSACYGVFHGLAVRCFVLIWEKDCRIRIFTVDTESEFFTVDTSNDIHSPFNGFVPLTYASSPWQNECHNFALLKQKEKLSVDSLNVTTVQEMTWGCR